MTLWNKMTNYWLPEKVSDKDFDMARLMLFIRVITAITFVGFFCSLGTYLYVDESTGAFYLETAGLTFGIYFVTLYIIKKWGNLDLAFHIGAGISMIFMMRFIYQLGGIYTTSILSIWIILIAAFFVASNKTGAIWGMVTVTCISFFYLIEVFKHEETKLIPANPSTRFIDLVFFTVYICFVLYSYEKNRTGLLDRMRKAQADLKKQNQSLIDLNREKETLMAIVAHDLKSPQNQLLSLMNLMEKEFNKQNLPIEYIDMGKTIVKNSLNLISDITYSKEISEGRLVQEKEPVHVTSFIKEEINTFNYLANEKNISIIQNINTNGQVIEIDKKIFSRIIQNIISNAIKFSPLGKNIFINTNYSPSTITISIKDEGPGIDKKEQRLLFKRFQKLSARPTNRESSSGLGLYIVKTLVDKIGARIEVISEKDKGAEFNIYIPQ